MSKRSLFSLAEISPKRYWTIALALGITVVALTGIVSYETSISQLTSRMHTTVDYIKSQSLTYDSYNDASTMKSVLRATENASQLARNLENDRDTSPEKLSEYVEELRLTSAFVLDENGNVISEYSTDDTNSEDLASVISSENLINVAKYPSKVYSIRTQLADDSYVDVAAACRTDAPGVAVACYHTAKEFAERYTLTLRSMLTGYNAVENGVIVIEHDGKLEATNDSSVLNKDGDELSATEENVIEAIKNSNVSGEITFIRQMNGAYLGMASKARDYYVYMHVSLSQFFSSIALAMSIALVAYSCAAGAVWMLSKRSKEAFLEESMEREREYSERLAEAAKAAQDANTAKTEFLQRMSHDIRTPINGIRGMVEVGDACANDLEKQADCRRKIWGASNLLLDLVNEVLDMSKLESGEVKLDLQPLDLNEMLFDLNEILERQAAANGVSILRKPMRIEHPRVLASSLHVKRLIMNVMSNAVKYNRQGGTVELTCDELSCENGVATYRISVKDTGIGMSEEFQRHAFEPFAQEHQEAAATTSGTGLGMPIAKSLAEIMGGSLEFESELGVGTTVRITLPLQIDDETPDSDDDSAKGPEEAVNIAGVHVLLAEDNELNREIAEFLLQDAGARITTVTDGKQAVEAFKASREGEFDVVIMDVMMPEMNGYEATKAIRVLDHPDATKVPIIAMTANAFTEDKRRAREAGMNDHIAKPFDVVPTIRTIARHVNAAKSKRQGNAD